MILARQTGHPVHCRNYDNSDDDEILLAVYGYI